MTPSKERTPLCPYHGDPAAMEFSSASKEYIACRKCDRENKTWYRPVEDWNKAYAWKQNDSLLLEVKRLREALEKIADDDTEPKQYRAHIIAKSALAKSGDRHESHSDPKL